MMFEAARLPKGTGTCMLYWSKPFPLGLAVCACQDELDLPPAGDISCDIRARPTNAGNANGNRLRTPRGKGPWDRKHDSRQTTHSSPRESRRPRGATHYVN